MNATTAFFTVWIGSFGLKGQDDVLIGRAMSTDERSCQATRLARPTFDAHYELVDEKVEA